MIFTEKEIIIIAVIAIVIAAILPMP